MRSAADGDHATFVKLAAGEVVGDVDRALADALDDELEPPYRAEAVRRGGDTWGVAGSRIDVIELPGLRGAEAELVVTRDGRTLRVDGLPAFDRIPALEAAGAAVGTEHVVRAMRLVGEAWEVEATAL